MAQAGNKGKSWPRLAAILLLLVAAGVGVAWAWPIWFAGPVAQASAAYRTGDFPRAAALARQRLRDQPDDSDALRVLARAAARMGQDDSAQAIYSRIGTAAMQAEDYFLVGSGLMRQGRKDAAKRVLELAWKADPDHAETLHDLARLRGSSDRLAEATDLVEKLAKRPGWEVRGLLMLGLLRNEQGDPAGAADAIGKALRQDPSLKGVSHTIDAVRKLYARALLASSQPHVALEPLRTVLAGGSDPEASWLLSRAALQLGRGDEAIAALEQAAGFGADKPQAPEPAPFVGSAKCAECHRGYYRSQHAGRHAKTFYATPEVAGLPWSTTTEPDPHDAKVVHSMRRDHDRVAFETRANQTVFHALVDYAFGSGDRGVTPVGHDDAGQFRELRLSHYGDGNLWDMTTGHPDHPQRPDEFLGQPLSRDSLRRCFDCHTTNVKVAAGKVEPVATDRGIGCERCHGPGGNHVRALATEFPDPAIGRPRLASSVQVMQLCGRCHSPRGITVAPSDPTSIRFQGTTLTWSRCYTESAGAMSCVTCHDPHRDAMTTPAFYEAKCLVCHGPATQPQQSPQVARPAVESSRTDGTRPIALDDTVRRIACPVNPRTQCLDCHMPRVKAAVPHTTFTDHYIRVHRPEQPAAKR